MILDALKVVPCKALFLIFPIEEIGLEDVSLERCFVPVNVNGRTSNPTTGAITIIKIIVIKIFF